MSLILFKADSRRLVRPYLLGFHNGTFGRRELAATCPPRSEIQTIDEVQLIAHFALHPCYGAAQIPRINARSDFCMRPTVQHQRNYLLQTYFGIEGDELNRFVSRAYPRNHEL
jgi:hypothetical protein